MSSVLSEATIDLVFPLSEVRSIRELGECASRPIVFFDEVARGFIVIRYPSIDKQGSFFRQLEIRVTSSFEQDKSGSSSAVKSPWYNPNGISSFWNGRAAKQQEDNSMAFSNDMILDTSLSPLFSEDGSFAAVPIDVRFGSAKDSSGLRDVQLTLSLMWKPPSDTELKPNSETMQVNKDAFICSVLGNMLEFEQDVTTFQQDRSKFPYSPQVALPLRRTIRKFMPIQSVFAARLVGTDVSTDDQENVILSIELENQIHSTLDIDSITIEILGAKATRYSLAGVEDTEFPHRLEPNEVMGYIYKIMYAKPSKNLAKSFDTSPIDVNITCTPHTKGTRGRSITSRSVCFLSDSFGTASFPRLNVPQSPLKSPELEQGVSISFSVKEDVVFLETFTVEVTISNRSHEAKRLALEIPRAAQLQDTRIWESGDLHVSMDPIDFLEKYDEECVTGASFVCLENTVELRYGRNANLRTLAPDACCVVPLHFIPIKGNGSLQRVECIKLVDLQSGFTNDIQNPIEVFIKAKHC